MGPRESATCTHMHAKCDIVTLMFDVSTFQLYTALNCQSVWVDHQNLILPLSQGKEVELVRSVADPTVDVSVEVSNNLVYFFL